MSERVPRMAQSYRLTEKELTIDGEVFPWLIDAKGPRIEKVPGYLPWAHVLWVPVLVDAIVPPIIDATDDGSQP